MVVESMDRLKTREGEFVQSDEFRRDVGILGLSIARGLLRLQQLSQF